MNSGKHIWTYKVTVADSDKPSMYGIAMKNSEDVDCLKFYNRLDHIKSCLNEFDKCVWMDKRNHTSTRMSKLRVNTETILKTTVDFNTNKVSW